MHPLFKEYGEQIIREVMDLFVFKAKLSNEQAKEMAVRHKFCTSRTKIVRAIIINEIYKRFTLYNTTGKKLFEITINSNEFNQIKEDLKQLNSK